MLVRRVLSALVLIPLVGAVVYVGGWLFTLTLILVALLAGYEYLALLTHLDLRPTRLIALLYVAVAIADAALASYEMIGWATWALVALGLAIEVFHSNRPGSLLSWAASVAGAIYIGLGLSHFVHLRALPLGIGWVGLALVGTWVSDSGAYFVGRRWGQRKLAPQVSPNKTWEGVVGGLLTGIPTVWLIAWLALDMPHWQGLVLGIVLVVAATLGDLAESVVKRQAGVKDSSDLIPGHGGMLDRVDSLLFVAPSIYYAAVLLAVL